ncbi:MAG TPA: hypothetical protein VHC71_12050 [Hyphomicrobium sp.]|nr:hypothetical protein [Hyphomicrobium sp.]
MTSPCAYGLKVKGPAQRCTQGVDGDVVSDVLEGSIPASGAMLGVTPSSASVWVTVPYFSEWLGSLPKL